MSLFLNLPLGNQGVNTLFSFYFPLNGSACADGLSFDIGAQMAYNTYKCLSIRAARADSSRIYNERTSFS